MTARPDPSTSQSLGTRIAQGRTRLGLTQQDLAARVAISRVALSNLESGRSVPGERTIALLAGVFDTEPHDLIAGTDYPAAKADRLPLAVARHTRAELLEALFQRDLTWLEEAPRSAALRVMEQWRADLAAELGRTWDARERERLESLLEIAVSQSPT